MENAYEYKAKAAYDKAREELENEYFEQRRLPDGFGLYPEGDVTNYLYFTALEYDKDYQYLNEYRKRYGNSDRIMELINVRTKDIWMNVLNIPYDEQVNIIEGLQNKGQLYTMGGEKVNDVDIDRLRQPEVKRIEVATNEHYKKRMNLQNTFGLGGTGYTVGDDLRPPINTREYPNERQKNLFGENMNEW